jgi:hypothetical protein
MKITKLATSIVAVGFISVLAVPAQAAVLDGWQMEITGDTYADIGRLSITGGSASVIQETNAAGNVFVGASFLEDGLAYDISYVTESVVGPGDNGPIVPFNSDDWLQLTFSDVMGQVTSVSGSGGFSYKFTSGSFSISDYNGTNSTLGTGSIIGVTGSFGDNFGLAGANGSSVIDIVLSSILGSPQFALYDSGGSPLDLTTVLFEAQTNNQLTEDVPAATTSCGSTGFANCIYLNNINSNGDAFLTTVPEPATLSLLGIGLLGMGAKLRRRKV